MGEGEGERSELGDDYLSFKLDHVLILKPM